MDITMLKRFLTTLFITTLIITGCQKSDPTEDTPQTPETPENPNDSLPETTKIETTFLEIVYWGDYYSSSTDSYTIYTGNAEHEGMFIKSAGDLIMLSLMTELSTNPNKIQLAPGTYTFHPR